MHQGAGRFGWLLRRLRQEAGLSQEALAERSGLTARAIRNLEYGRSSPRTASTRRLALALGMEGPAVLAFEAAAEHVPRPGAEDAAESESEAVHLLLRLAGAVLADHPGLPLEEVVKRVEAAEAGR